MAKRSDFAQKLLDDLRLRKERMAVDNQSSSRQNSAAQQGAYPDSRQANKGSGELMKMKNTSSVGSKMDHRQRMSSNSRKLPVVADDSRQIVPLGKGKSTEHVGDLSMALTFAFENAGKFSTMHSSGSKSLLCILQQIGGRSPNSEKMERKASLDMQRFPTLSDMHVNQISKGAQKLNQVLMACSNGIKFDGYSVEIGKELFKGAIDLEESLRKLVSLQEASEYMVKPQNKGRVRLLETGEDDEEGMSRVAEEMQLARPRFSFDKPPRISHGNKEVERNGVKGSLLLPTKSASHRHSASYGSEYGKEKTQALGAKPARKGIPNVIAKLMGLEEIPEHVDSKYSMPKESSSKQANENNVMKKNLKIQTHKETVITQSPKVNQNLIGSRDLPVGTRSELQDEKHKTKNMLSTEMAIYEAKPPWKVEEYARVNNLVGAGNKSFTESKSQQDKFNLFNQMAGSPVHIQNRGRAQENVKNTKGLLLPEAKVPGLKENLEMVPFQRHSSPEANFTSLSAGKRNTKKYLENAVQARKSSTRAEQKIRKNRSEHIEKQKLRQKLKRMRKHKGTEDVTKTLSEPNQTTADPVKMSPHANQETNLKNWNPEAAGAIQDAASRSTRHNKNPVQEMSPITAGNLEQDDSSKDGETETEGAKASIVWVSKEEAAQTTGLEKRLDKSAKRKCETPHKIEVMTRKTASIAHNSAMPLRHQTSTLQGIKQRMNDKTSRLKEASELDGDGLREAEVRIVQSAKSEANVQPLDVSKNLKEVEKHASELYSPEEEICPHQGNLESPSSIDSCKDMVAQVPGQVNGQPLDYSKNLKSHDTALAASDKGKCDDRTEISYVSEQVQKREITKARTPEPLTEEEFQLKQTLVLNQLFLNTAEALFKLNIPIGILNAGEQNHPDDETKLKLDCGYEIMKRKGTTQELWIHPLMKMSIIYVKVKSLDDLVKQLHANFENLKCYGGDDESDETAKCLLKMVEKDLQHRDAEVNCMWDLGWSDQTFSFMERDEVVRDLEKYLLNGLIDEIAGELVNL